MTTCLLGKHGEAPGQPKIVCYDYFTAYGGIVVISSSSYTKAVYYSEEKIIYK